MEMSFLRLLSLGRITKMKKNILHSLHKQNGFTLVELLAAFLIAAILLAALVRFSQTAYSVKDDITGQANAVNQAKNAFNYISQDAQMAGMVITYHSNFPLTLTWTDYATNTTVDVVYSIVNSKIQRNYYENTVLKSTMNVASNVIAAQSNCIWSNEDPLDIPKKNRLTINLTISTGSVNLTRQFIITPRVIAIPSGKVATSIVGNSSPNPSYFGQTVTLTATVAPSIASGVVIFLDGGNPIYPSPIVNGQASYLVSNLPVGTHTITAEYSGDANYTSSISTAWTQEVDPAPTTVSLTLAHSPEILGNKVEFTAQVGVTYLSSIVPTGTVTFKDGGVALPGNDITLDATGQAIFDIYTLSLGSHAITAVYSGDSNYSTSTSPPVTQLISGYPTTCSLSSDHNPSTPAQLVTFTATVSVNSPYTGTPTGTVTFYDNNGATTLGTGTLSSGKATFSISTLTAGTHTITAVYGGGSNYSGSSGALTQTVIGPPVASHSTLSPTLSSIIANGIATQVLTVQAKDANNISLKVGGATVLITQQSGVGTISPVTDNTDGTYTATVTSGTTPGTSGVFVATLNGSTVNSSPTGGGTQTQATVNYVTGNDIDIISATLWHNITTGTGPGGQPSSADTITVHGGATLTVDVPYTGPPSKPEGQAYAINLSDTNGTGTLTFLSSGKVTVYNITIGGSQNGTVNMAGGYLVITGSMTLGNHGAFNAGTSTVSYGGSAAQTIITAINYYNLMTNGSGTKTLDGTLTVNGSLTINSGTTLNVGSNNMTVAGNCTNSGTFTQSGGTSTFNGTAQSITGTGATTFNNLTLSGSSTKTLGAAITVNGNLSIGNGITLDVSTSNYALTVNGNWSNSGTFTPRNGTVTLSGTGAQSITGATTFYNLSLSGGNTTTLAAAITVSGNLNIASGDTLDVSTSNYAVTVNGSWTNSGTFTARSGTVTLNGASAQMMSGNAMTFYNLILNNAAGLTISNNETITHTLTLTAGIITTGSNVVIAYTGTTNATVTASTSGYVYGNLRKYVATGTIKFEVGTNNASDYTPVTLTFSNVATAGTLTVNATGVADYTSIPNYPGTSGLSTTNYVKVYWTLINSGIILGSGSNFKVAPLSWQTADNVGSYTSWRTGWYKSSWTVPTCSSTSTSVTVTGTTLTNSLWLASSGTGEFAVGH